eukprot:g51536.t1
MDDTAAGNSSSSSSNSSNVSSSASGWRPDKSENEAVENELPPPLDLSKEKHVFFSNVLPTPIGSLHCSAFSHIGKRKNQEDRFVFCPDLLDGEYAFFGVFDGTVKEHASEWVHKHILPILLETPAFRKFHALSKEQKVASRSLLEQATREMYHQTDAALIQYCSIHEYHYASTTAVTALVHFPSNVMVVANLGDSHLVMGGKPAASPSPSGKTDGKSGSSSTGGDSAGGEGASVEPSHVSAVMVTAPHRADHAKERARIEEAGGSVVYIHNKPFIRGGDFHYRHHAMQLNYSRAFGGKDLKPYGLSCQPNIFSIPINFSKGSHTPEGKIVDSVNGEGKGGLSSDEVGVVLMGSDGVWDVINPKEAVTMAYRAQEQYLAFEQRQRTEKEAGEEQTQRRERPPSPSEALVQIALVNHKYKGSSDNVTALVFFLL